MTQTATYTERQFIQDVRASFAATNDTQQQAHGIAQHLRHMLAQPGWPENSTKFGEGYGTFLIHADQEHGHPLPGFMVLAYRSAPKRDDQPASPHDHGACFVVYGVKSGSNMQTRYRWRHADDASAKPTLEAYEQVLQKPGDAHYFLPGEVHSTQGSTEEDTIYVRVTSMDLDQVWRHRYNLQNSSSRALQSATAAVKES
jgi:hypothetical protein